MTAEAAGAGRGSADRTTPIGLAGRVALGSGGRDAAVNDGGGPWPEGRGGKPLGGRGGGGGMFSGIA